MKRSRHEIYYKILEVCANGANKTRIVYQANLNFQTVTPYLETLIDNNFLEAIHGEHVIYRTTKEGANLEENLRQVNNALFHL